MNKSGVVKRLDIFDSAMVTRLPARFFAAF